jgi:hypothetical protein
VKGRMGREKSQKSPKMETSNLPILEVHRESVGPPFFPISATTQPQTLKEEKTKKKKKKKKKQKKHASVRIFYIQVRIVGRMLCMNFNIHVWQRTPLK